MHERDDVSWPTIADSCGLATVSYHMWNWKNARNNTHLQIAAQPNLTQYRKLIVLLLYLNPRRNNPKRYPNKFRKIQKI